jgi:hypothetical protein
VDGLQPPSNAGIGDASRRGSGGAAYICAGLGTMLYRVVTPPGDEVSQEINGGTEDFNGGPIEIFGITSNLLHHHLDISPERAHISSRSDLRLARPVSMKTTPRSRSDRPVVMVAST